MSSTAIMDAIVAKIKSVLSESGDVLASEVTPQNSEEVNRLLGQAISAGWTEGPRTWLSTAEIDAETIEVDGVTYRHKLDGEKESPAPGGMLELSHRVYQPDAGGKCRIPLDAAWGMEGEFATAEVRDAAPYAVAACVGADPPDSTSSACAPTQDSIRIAARAVASFVTLVPQWRF